MSFAEAVSSVLSKYATFEGRARRQEYWYWYLAVLLAEVVVGIIWSISADLGPWIALIFGLGVILPSIAVAVRRLHDTNRTGWWILIALIPLGGFVLLVFFLLDGTPGDNKHGPSPKLLPAQ